MKGVLLLPVKVMGWAAFGMAAAVGWKLGSHLVDVALDKEARDRFFEKYGCSEESEEPPLWKRRFSKVSQD